MKFVITFIVFLIFLVMILVPALGIGWLLSLILPEVDLGMCVLIGTLVTGIAFHFVGIFVGIVEEVKYAMYTAYDDEEDEDDERIEIVYPVVPPVGGGKRTSGSSRRKRGR